MLLLLSLGTRTLKLCRLLVLLLKLRLGGGAMVSSAVHSYGESEYWDERYSKEGPAVVFDWYQKYDALRPLFEKYLKREGKLLMVGCGNSALSEDMSRDGYNDICNIDISPVVIEAMREKHKENPKLTYKVMDVKELDFSNSSFDAVIDKGTLDSLMCGDNSVENAHKMLLEVSRVLKPRGCYILITYGEPRSRVSHLEHHSLPWSIRFHVIPRPGVELPLDDGSNLCFDSKRILEPASIGLNNTILPWGIPVDSGSVHYIYACQKTDHSGQDGVSDQENSHVVNL